MREEFLDLLRTDPTFREAVRRQLLTDELLALPGRFDHLTELVGQGLSILRDTVGVVQSLTAAQRRTEEGLQQLGERVEALTAAQRRTEEGLQRQGEQIQALIQAQRRTEEQVGRLDGRMERVEAALEQLTAAQRRTEEELRWLVSWQRGEAGRRDGERFEREMIRRAPALFNGGQGGAPDQPGVQQRLTEQLGAFLAQELVAAEDDPFLADLLWWKGEQLAVVEISVQVHENDMIRAARRAATLRRAGAQALAVVIGEHWVTSDTREQALAMQVEWKVGSDLSEGFLTFRRLPH